MAVTMMKAAFVLFAAGLAVMGNPSLACAEMATTDVAYVESPNGRAVALISGETHAARGPRLIDERTRLDVLANSEVRIRHYGKERLLTLKGPLRYRFRRDS